MEMIERYVLHHPEWGIFVGESLGLFVGESLGLGFWSGIDPAGQNSAPTFPTEDEAQKWIGAFDDCKGVEVRPVRVPRVRIDDAGYCPAYIPEIIAGGLPGWDPQWVPEDAHG